MTVAPYLENLRQMIGEQRAHKLPLCMNKLFESPVTGLFFIDDSLIYIHAVYW